MEQARLHTALYIALCTLIFASFLTISASAIDCNKVASKFESAVCSDPELLAKDARLNRAFKLGSGRVKISDYKSYKTSQALWLRSTNVEFERLLGFENKNDLNSSIAAAFDDRIRTLTSKQQFGPGPRNHITPILRGTDQPDGVELVVDYQSLEFANPKTTGELLFNKELAKMDPGLEDVALTNGVPAKPFFEGRASALATLVYASAHLVSAHITTYKYDKGQAHGWSSAYNINIDLQSGKTLSFIDLFGQETIDYFQTACAVQGKEGLITEEEILHRISDQLSDLRNWSLRGDGAIVSFPSYSIGGYQQPIEECKFSARELRKFAWRGFELWK